MKQYEKYLQINNVTIKFDKIKIIDKTIYGENGTLILKLNDTVIASILILKNDRIKLNYKIKNTHIFFKIESNKEV